MKLSIKTDFSAVRRRLRELPDQVGKQALARTLNEVAAKANTQMQREIAAEYTLNRAKIRSGLGIRRASRNYLVAVVFARRSGRGKALHLTEFQAKDTRGRKRGGGQGVLVRIKRGGPQKRLRNAFIAKAKNSRKAIVFQRRGKERLPIDAIKTIDLPNMFNARRINQKVVEQIRRDLPVTFERNARFYLSRF